MTLMRYVLAGTMAMVLGQTARAAETDCGTAQTQSVLTQCADKAYKAADKALNLLYGEMFNRYAPKYKILFRDAERRWIAYRDAECRFETAQSEDGTIHAMVYAQCAKAKTEARIAELKAQQNCAEGDTTCNKP